MYACKRDDFKHFLQMDIRWGDMDVLGHVNNTLFYRYSEEGRLNYFLQFGLEATQSSAGPILADLRCSFLQQLRWPAQIEIATRTWKFGNSSLHMQQALFRRNEKAPVATYETVVVWFDYARQATSPVPESIRSAIRELEIVPPE